MSILLKCLHAGQALGRNDRRSQPPRFFRKRVTVLGRTGAETTRHALNNQIIVDLSRIDPRATKADNVGRMIGSDVGNFSGIKVF